MNKLTEITKAWWNVATAGQDIKSLAKERMAVCQKCPFQQVMLGVEVCGVCHCPLLGKTHSPEKSCPKSKWEK
jgi:hypothetical protein